jgi:hypothetical protein
MASTIFSSPAVCDLADAVDEQLRHRARRREHVCGSISCFCIRDVKELLIARKRRRELVGTWRAAWLESDRAKPRCVVKYLWMIRTIPTYNGSLSLTLVNSPLSAQAPIQGGVSHEDTTCNNCIGDTGEFVCSRSIPQLAGLLRCVRSGPAVFCVSLLRLQPCLCSSPAVCRLLRRLRSGPVFSYPRLLRPLRPTLTVPVQRVRHSWPIHWLGSGSPRAQSARE